MLRSVVASVRAKLVGPSLSRLSQLRMDEVETLKIFLAEDPLAPAIFTQTPKHRPKSSGMTRVAGSPEIENEIRDLKAKISALTERVDVLERLNYKATAKE